MKDFFICYAQADRQWAEWITYQLEEEGFSTVLLAQDFRKGKKFGQEIERDFKDFKCAIVVLSPDFLELENAHLELSAASINGPTKEHRKPLFICVREIQTKGLLAATPPATNICLTSSCFLLGSAASFFISALIKSG